MSRVIAGRYQLVEVIGRGSMGTVYAARHLLTGEALALKLIGPRGTDAGLRLERFRREAGVAARIQHPGVVRVQDAGRTEEDELFVVMERLIGFDLEALLNKGMNPETGARLVRAALEPLAAAHSVGVVHRDLKPHNVFLHRPGGGEPSRAVLLDFGISKYVDESDSGTRTDMGVGTPDYMSPEQATDTRSVATTADVWSIGVVLFRVLTGRLPFSRATPFNTLKAVCEAPVPQLPSDAPDIAKQLWPLVLACLRKEPGHRPKDGGVVAAGFDALMRAGVPRPPGALSGGAPEEPSAPSVDTPAPPVAGVETAPPVVGVETAVEPLEPRPRSRSRAGLVAVVCAALLGLGFVTLRASRAPSPAALDAGKELGPKTLEAGKELGPKTLEAEDWGARTEDPPVDPAPQPSPQPSPRPRPTDPALAPPRSTEEAPARATVSPPPKARAATRRRASRTAKATPSGRMTSTTTTEVDRGDEASPDRGPGAAVARDADAGVPPEAGAGAREEESVEVSTSPTHERRSDPPSGPPGRATQPSPVSPDAGPGHPPPASAGPDAGFVSDAGSPPKRPDFISF